MKKIGFQFNKSMNIISDLFSEKSFNEEESISITEPDISILSVEFDMMNNDVVTLKPSHELHSIQKKKEKVLSELSLKDSNLVNESIDQNNNLMNFIDFKFDHLVSFINKYFEA